MSIFQKPEYGAGKRKEIPEGLWVKCVGCGEVLFQKQLEENWMVCPKCEFHFTLTGHARLDNICDPESFEEHDSELSSVDTLQFTGVASYRSRLKAYQEKTGLKDAVISGTGEIEGMRTSLAVIDFHFLGGSMGAVVGEKITRSIERACEKKLPLVVFSASGGARMYEGMFSLMQMAKTSGALARLAQKKLPFISVLTNPTMAGVMASFASLGDLILAEPKAMIGFAGARVIKETTQQQLPQGFQTAEFLLDHGLIDQIVHRKKMRATLAQILRYLK